MLIAIIAPPKVEVNKVDENGVSILQYAAYREASRRSDNKQHCNIINVLIDRFRGNINGGSEEKEYKNSLLYYAICGGNPLLVENLLKRGVDPNLTGTSFFIFIVIINCLSCFNNEGVKPHFTAVTHAAATNSVQILQILIKYGATYDITQMGGIKNYFSFSHLPLTP